LVRGEVWWANLPQPAGRRPVLLLSRNHAILVRDSVTVAFVTRTVRRIQTEVGLGREDGMPKPCVVNTDVIQTVLKSDLAERITALSVDKMAAVDDAVRYALALD
jgi:mRNA interferase MazF